MDWMKRWPAVLLVVCISMTGCKPKDVQFVTIGTGSVTGIYYPTGGAIARMINKRARVYRIKATVESTGGSVYNVNAVLRGDLDFGTVQSDRQYQAFHGLAEWADRGPQTELRSVFSIHPESITLVASKDSGIETVEDLKGKRVNLGNIGSGHLQNAKDVLAAAGLTEQDLDAEYVRALERRGCSRMAGSMRSSSPWGIRTAASKRPPSGGSRYALFRSKGRQPITSWRATSTTPGRRFRPSITPRRSTNMTRPASESKPHSLLLRGRRRTWFMPLLGRFSRTSRSSNNSIPLTRL